MTTVTQHVRRRREAVRAEGRAFTFGELTEALAGPFDALPLDVDRAAVRRRVVVRRPRRNSKR